MDATSVKLPAPLRNRLAAEARRRNVTQSTVVRESLERFLGSNAEGAASATTCIDLVSDLIGAVRSGRRDLGSNKALLLETVIKRFQSGAKRRR